MLLEPAAARTAFPLSRKQQRLLEENISATRKSKTLDEVTTLDLDFHQLIVEASGKTRLLKLWRSLRTGLELWLGYLLQQHRDRDLNTRVDTADLHEVILHCFKIRSLTVAIHEYWAPGQDGRAEGVDGASDTAFLATGTPCKACSSR